jgi:hypothetical protein
VIYQRLQIIRSLVLKALTAPTEVYERHSQYSALMRFDHRVHGVNDASTQPYGKTIPAVKTVCAFFRAESAGVVNTKQIGIIWREWRVANALKCND